MRDLLEADVLNRLDELSDPVERYVALGQLEANVTTILKSERQRIALELKHQHGKTWREVGRLLGGVTAQRAEQISKGI